MQKAQNRIKNLEATLQAALLKGSQNTKLFLDLGRAHHQFYEKSHQVKNLENAIKHYKNGLEYVPLHEAHHAPLAFHLGNALMTRFREEHDLQDLKDAIAFHEKALELRPAGHQDHHISLYKLAAARAARFQEVKEGDMEDLQEAITLFEQALVLCSSGHPGRLGCLQGLARALTTRFSKLKETEDLQQAIVFSREALELCPSGDPDRSASLNGLARGLLTRFRVLDEIADVQEAVSLYEQALRLRPAGHPGRGVSLRNLAGALAARHGKLGEIKDLQAAIEFYERSFRLCPDGHPSQDIALEGLADVLMARFRRLNELKDLNRAIGLYEKVLKLHLADHPKQSSSSHDLGDALFIRFRKQGDLKDLEEAISLFKKSLSLHPSGSPIQHFLLQSTAAASNARYKLLWDPVDLHEAIIYSEKALELCPTDSPMHTKSLENLAQYLITRFKHQKDIKDLQQCIDLHERALDLCPPGNSSRPAILDMFVQVFVLKFERLKSTEDLQKAIAFGREAVDMCPAGEPERPGYLYGLAHALKLRAQHLKEVKGMREATALYKEALELHPDGHPEKPIALKNLAMAFQLQFKYTGDMSALESAESCYKMALSCSPPGHAFCSVIISFQASLVMALHESDWVVCQGCPHVDEACALFEKASNYTTSTLQERLFAASNWAELAYDNNHQSALIAYSTALELQQQLLFLLPPAGPNPRNRAFSLRIGSNAVSCAIEMEKPETAIQFMELARAMLWSTIRGYKHPYTRLLTKNSELAKGFRTIGHQMMHYTSLTDDDISHQHVIHEQWTTLLGKIRGVDGFSEYLQITPFETLKDAAKEGPVIMLNIDDQYSHAIILTNTTSVIVKLPGAAPDLLHYLWKCSNAAVNIGSSKHMFSVLQHLWYAVVQPVVEQLTMLQVPEKSHIWWCPTSSFSSLPLHAAGPYKKGFKNLPDLYISSYTSTLESLIKAREGISKPQSVPNLLLISQPEDIIPKMLEETKVVEELGKGNINIDVCSGEDAHKETVLAGLQSHSWVHFCCHGHLADHSSGTSVFKPWLQLHDKEPLTLLELGKAQIPNADFAFLSACHRATKSARQSPNLFTNLTTALQVCGFKSVIGTLWEVVDDDGPIVANAFYRHMFHNVGGVDMKGAAEALNAATREMRKQKVPIEQWVNYIHVGV